jgi:hypothetical protein
MDTNKEFDEMTREEILDLGCWEEDAHELEDGEGSEAFEGNSVN